MRAKGGAWEAVRVVGEGVNRRPRGRALSPNCEWQVGSGERGWQGHAFPRWRGSDFGSVKFYEKNCLLEQRESLRNDR
jgi:hypothetical protein